MYTVHGQKEQTLNFNLMVGISNVKGLWSTEKTENMHTAPFMLQGTCEPEWSVDTLQMDTQGRKKPTSRQHLCCKSKKMSKRKHDIIVLFLWAHSFKNNVQKSFSFPWWDIGLKVVSTDSVTYWHLMKLVRKERAFLIPLNGRNRPLVQKKQRTSDSQSYYIRT